MMNRILFRDRADRYELGRGDPRLEHARGVLRAKQGDVFDIGVVNGPAGKGRVVELTDEGLRIEAEWGEYPPPLPPIHLLIGLSRPQTMRRILQETTTLGVSSLHFTATSRSDPAYQQSRLWRDDQWRDYLIAGAEQAFDTRIPEVYLYENIMTASAQLPKEGMRIALDVYTRESCWRAVGPESKPVTVAIGPERGWTMPEQTLLRDQMFRPSCLTARVLRVETATVAAVVLVQQGLGFNV